MKESSFISKEITTLVKKWEPLLIKLPAKTIMQRRNKQNRNIKQIVGHMIDSATNNTHRIVHLQYQKSPFSYPNYASNGNNDRWIAIQNYQAEEWKILVQLWKLSLLHITHVIKNIDDKKLNNVWIAGPGKKISLKTMVVDFVPHLTLHLSEIDDLIKKK